MKTKAIFLDRDGTINEEMGYINHVSRFQIFDFVPDAIRIFNNLGFKVFVVTNQSGVARGYFSEELVMQLHQKLMHDLTRKSVHIENIYYCPHHPSEGTGIYKKDCECRKPKPGMVKNAEKEYNLDLQKSYMIGDRYKDVVYGKSLGLKTIMVLTGYGKGEYTFQKETWKIQPNYIAENLLEAAKQIQALEVAINKK